MQDADSYDEPLVDFAELRRRKIISNHGHLEQPLSTNTASRRASGQAPINTAGHRDRFGNGWRPGRQGRRRLSERAPPSRLRLEAMGGDFQPVTMGR